MSHYQIVDQLGAGGMGVVYCALDTRLRRHVALKVLPADKASSEERRRRFLQEARAASALSHPGIVTVHDIVRDEELDLDVLVMELVEGQTLDQLIPEAGLAFSKALSIARQIAEALAAAHAAGIVHRDLKPGNVMVGPSGRVKVLDFGLARIDPRGGSDEPTVSVALTRAGTLLGTVEYMAPEQARGETATAKSDVFSLGAMVYEMVAGRRPFAGKSLPELLHDVVYEEPTPLGNLRAATPTGFAELVHASLAKSPAGRPEMAEIVDGLAALEAGRAPTLASLPSGSASVGRSSGVRSPGPGTRTRGAAWRRRIAALAAVFAVALAAAAGWFAWRRAGGEPDAAVELPRTAYDFLRQGQALLERYDKQGYVDRAVENLKQAIGIDPRHAAAHAAMGRAYYLRYREKRDPMWLDLAESNARQGLELDPQLVAGHVALGFVEVERGHTGEAQALFDKALVLDPGNADAFSGRAELALAKKDWAAAEADYERAREVRPGDWQLFLRQGVGRLRAGNYPAAVASLAEAARLAPDSALVLRNLGVAHHYAGDVAAASSAFQKSLEIVPDAALYSNLGTLHFYRGLYREALGAFDRAVQLGANDHAIWTNLGDAQRWSGGGRGDSAAAYARAVQILDAELAEKPEDLDLGTRRAVALAKGGSGLMAREAIAKLRDSSLDPPQNYRLGQAAEVIGDRETALTLLERALVAGYPLEELRRDPEFGDLRSDVRFHQLLVRRGAAVAAARQDQ